MWSTFDILEDFSSVWVNSCASVPFCVNFLRHIWHWWGLSTMCEHVNQKSPFPCKLLEANFTWMWSLTWMSKHMHWNIILMCKFSQTHLTLISFTCVNEQMGGKVAFGHKFLEAYFAFVGFHTWARGVTHFHTRSSSIRLIFFQKLHISTGNSSMRISDIHNVKLGKTSEKITSFCLFRAFCLHFPCCGYSTKQFFFSMQLPFLLHT